MFDYVKKHPYLTGGLVLVAIVAFMVLRSALSGSSADASTSASAGGLSEGGQLSALQMGYAYQASQGQVAATLQQSANDTSVGLAQTYAARDVALATSANDNYTQQYIASKQADVASLGINASTQLGAIQSQLQSQTDLASINSNRDLVIHGIDASLASSMAGFDRDVSVASIGANRDIDLANIQGQVTLGQAGLDAAIASKTLDVASLGITTDYDLNSQALKAASDYATLQQNQRTSLAQMFYKQASDGSEYHTNELTLAVTALGYPDVGSAAQAKTAAESQASANKWSNILSSISSAASRVIQPVKIG
jgi:hypothetical protein